MNFQIGSNIKIAWRNLWRNKRRTLITISSIFFAVFIAILMRSFQLGSYNHMIDNMITQFTGHLQIQDKEYLDNPSIDYSVAFTDSIKQILDENEHVDFYFPRIQTGALASSGNDSKVAIIMGVDYQKENDLIDLKKNIARYYISSSIFNKIVSNMDNKNAQLFEKYKDKVFSNLENLCEDLFADGIDTSKYLKTIIEESKLPEVSFNKYGEDVLIGYKIAQFLELELGDSIVLLGQGFHGSSAVGKFKIGGYIKFPSDAFNDRFIYMPIHTAQTFMSAYELNNNSDTTYYVNYIAVNTIYQASMRTADYKKMLNVKQEIEDKFDDELLTVVGWHNLNKDLIQGIEMDNVGGKVMIFVLYLIIAFGVLGTVMMMIAERKREFGVMMAIGMKRKRLSIIVSLEMFFLGLIAAVLGIILTAPIIWYGNKFPVRLQGETAHAMDIYNMEPVLPFQFFDTYIIAQLLVVVFIVAIALVYALFKIRKMKVISALRA